MPENIEARHRLVDFLYESRVKSFDAGDSRTSFAFSAKQNQSGSPEKLARETSGDSANHIESLLLSHCPDDSADHGARRPAALATPVARMLDLRRRNSRIHDLDTVGRNSRFHHDCFHSLGYRNECIDAVSIFES